MIAIFDAAYRDERGAAACLLAGSWEAGASEGAFVATHDDVAAYAPGQFYKRELPLLLAALPQGRPISACLVDGYVWLGPENSPGLGAHLHAALGGRAPVVGVAKTKFAGAAAIEVLRGRSRRPLFVTAIGMEPDHAGRLVARMHGDGRLPTLIREADRRARRALDCWK